MYGVIRQFFQSGELFRRKYFLFVFDRFYSIRECNKHFSFLVVGLPPAFTIQVMLSIAVESVSSIIWKVNPMPSP